MVANGIWKKIFGEGIMIGLLTLFAFYIGTTKYSLEVGRTMAFVSLSTLELIHSFNIRSDDTSLFEIGVFKNKYLVGAFLLGFILQASVVLIKPIANIFDVVALDKTQWLYTIIISILPIVIIEIKKKLHENLFGKRVYNIYTKTA